MEFLVSHEERTRALIIREFDTLIHSAEKRLAAAYEHCRGIPRFVSCRRDVSSSSGCRSDTPSTSMSLSSKGSVSLAEVENMSMMFSAEEEEMDALVEHIRKKMVKEEQRCAVWMVNNLAKHKQRLRRALKSGKPIELPKPLQKYDQVLTKCEVDERYIFERSEQTQWEDMEVLWQVAPETRLLRLNFSEASARKRLEFQELESRDTAMEEITNLVVGWKLSGGLLLSNSGPTKMSPFAKRQAAMVKRLKEQARAAGEQIASDDEDGAALRRGQSVYNPDSLTFFKLHFGHLLSQEKADRHSLTTHEAYEWEKISQDLAVEEDLIGRGVLSTQKHIRLGRQVDWDCVKAMSAVVAAPLTDTIRLVAKHSASVRLHMLSEHEVGHLEISAEEALSRDIIWKQKVRFDKYGF